MMAESQKPQQNTETVHAGGTAKPVFPPFDAANFPSQILWFALAFGALYLLMARVGLPRVADVLKMRRDRIAGDLDEATHMQAKAKEAGVAYDKTLADAKARAQDLAAQTHAKLKADTETKRRALDADLNAKLAVSEAQISDMKTKAMANVGAIAREAATEIVRHLSGKTPDSQAIAKAVATTEF